MRSADLDGHFHFMRKKAKSTQLKKLIAVLEHQGCNAGLLSYARRVEFASEEFRRWLVTKSICQELTSASQPKAIQRCYGIVLPRLPVLEDKFLTQERMA
jgi:hypothetical protein